MHHASKPSNSMAIACYLSIPTGDCPYWCLLAEIPFTAQAEPQRLHGILFRNKETSKTAQFLGVLQKRLSPFPDRFLSLQSEAGGSGTVGPTMVATGTTSRVHQGTIPMTSPGVRRIPLRGKGRESLHSTWNHVLIHILHVCFIETTIGMYIGI